MLRLMESVLDHPGSDAVAAAPAAEPDLDLVEVLQALSDPIRLRIVAKLADGGEYGCNSVELPIVKSTRSHHFSVLREAGVISQRTEGKSRLNRLRRAELEQRFPGLLDAVLGAFLHAQRP
jgi:DNA-binding transcriptional ArsR family regulator